MNLREYKKHLTIDNDIVKSLIKGDQNTLYTFIQTNIDKGATTEDLLDFAVDLLTDGKYPVKYFKQFCTELGLSSIRINFKIPKKRVGVS